MKVGEGPFFSLSCVNVTVVFFEYRLRPRTLFIIYFVRDRSFIRFFTIYIYMKIKSTYMLL